MGGREGSDGSRSVGCLYGYCVILLSFGFFVWLQRFVERHCTPDRIDKSERWRWKNIVLSLVHATIIGIWVLLSFYLYPEMTDDLISHYNLFTYSAISFSTGYFISDSFDLIISDQARTLLPVSLHHVVVVWIFLYNVTNCTCIGYTIVALLVELNSIFLHLRKLMKIWKVNQRSLLYRANAVVTLLTIVTCRFAALGRISYGIITSYDQFSTTFIYLLAASIGVMWIIYIMSFYHILKADFLQKESNAEYVSNGSIDIGSNNGLNNNHNSTSREKLE